MYIYIFSLRWISLYSRPKGWICFGMYCSIDPLLVVFRWISYVYIYIYIGLVRSHGTCSFVRASTWKMFLGLNTQNVFYGSSKFEGAQVLRNVRAPGICSGLLPYICNVFFGYNAQYEIWTWKIRKRNEYIILLLPPHRIVNSLNTPQRNNRWE